MLVVCNLQVVVNLRPSCDNGDDPGAAEERLLEFIQCYACGLAAALRQRRDVTDAFPTMYHTMRVNCDGDASFPDAEEGQAHFARPDYRFACSEELKAFKREAWEQHRQQQEEQDNG